MGIFTDILTLVVFAGCIVFSYRKGFLRSAIELVGYFVSAAVASALSVPVGNWIYQNFVSGIVQNRVREYLYNSINSAAAQKATETVSASGLQNFGANMPDQFKSLLSVYHISSSSVSDIAGSAIQTGSSAAADRIIQTVAVPIGQSLSRTVAFLILIALFMTAVGVVAQMAQRVNRLPVLGAANRVAGAAVGFIKAFVIMMILIPVISVFSSLFSLGGSRSPTVPQASVSSDFFNNLYNPIEHILLKK